MSTPAPTEIKRPSIKKVVIHGFLSYGDEGDIEEFDPGMNVLVGTNGAGKSNFMAAICFVLGSDRFYRIQPEDRKQLLHRGPQGSTISGFVELHLQNMGDNVAPGLPSDVVVKRIVGLKKDEYAMNGKRADREDIINLFETIGFSRSNPYNIVLQGQVDLLTAMSAEERLNLVKDIAGASLYDDKRAESIKLLGETEEKMNKVDDVIGTLEKRIQDLEQDKNELTAFQSADKRRRALEHQLRVLELDDVERHLSRLDLSRTNMTEQAQTAHDDTIRLEQEIEALEVQLREATHEVEKLTAEKTERAAEVASLKEQRGRLTLELNDAKGNTQADRQKEAEVDKELAKLNKEIAGAQKRLKEVSGSYQTALDAEQESKNAFNTKDVRAKELYAKQGRIAQFKTKKERDQHIRAEIAKLSAAKSGRISQTSTLESDIASLETTVKSLQSKINSRTERQTELTDKVKSATAEYDTAKESRDKAADARKDQWKQLKELEEDLFRMKADLVQEKRTLESTMNRELVSGLEAVSKIKLPPRHTVYGPLLDLINVEETFYTAVEVTAGNALFHVVVDTDETAGLVLKELLNTRSGRVTCIPLNRVPAQNKLAGLEVDEKTTTKLPELIEHDITFTPAINQIFGKTLVCSSLDLATRLSQQHKVGCVTLDGSQVNVKGALTGGYHDSRVSRLRSSIRMRTLQQQIADTEKKIEDLRKNSEALEERITRHIKTMAEIERQRAEAVHLFETFADTTRSTHRDLLAAKDALEKRKQSSKDNDALIVSLEASIETLETELSSALFANLSDEENAELQQLSTELDGLAMEVADATTKRTQFQATKTELEASLGGNLYPRQAELEAQKAHFKMVEFTGAVSAQSISSLDKELEATGKTLAEQEKRLTTSEQNLTAKKRAVDTIQTKIDTGRQNLAKAQAALEERSKEMEKAFGSRATLTSKRDDLVKRIREIGSLSSKASEEVAGLNQAQCAHELKVVKEDLSKMTGINKKALDQFMSYTEERDKFLDRKTQMDKEKQAIEDLIARLDLQKEEAIRRTFNGVAFEFNKVFADVCPDGSASLIMRVQKSTEEILSQKDKPQHEKIVGIDIRVSFGKNQTAKEGVQVRQLSGGQRTITALALIFAIQRCDPAPFYIFDEIDPALDDRYRSTIAQLIKSMSDTTQFLIVTHRPEMVNAADKVYTISFANRVSHVQAVDADTALKVVHKAELEDEQEAKRAADPHAKKKPAPAKKTSSKRKGKAESEEEDDKDKEVQYAPKDSDDELLHPPEEEDIVERPKRRAKRPRPEDDE